MILSYTTRITSGDSEPMAFQTFYEKRGNIFVLGYHDNITIFNEYISSLVKGANSPQHITIKLVDCIIDTDLFLRINKDNYLNDASSINIKLKNSKVESRNP